MRTAQTILTVIQECGKQHKSVERVYKLLEARMGLSHRLFLKDKKEP